MSCMELTVYLMSITQNMRGKSVFLEDYADIDFCTYYLFFSWSRVEDLIGDVFIGYNSDACASVVINVCHGNLNADCKEVLCSQLVSHEYKKKCCYIKKNNSCFRLYSNVRKTFCCGLQHLMQFYVIWWTHPKKMKPGNIMKFISTNRNTEVWSNT